MTIAAERRMFVSVILRVSELIPKLLQGTHTQDRTMKRRSCRRWSPWQGRERQLGRPKLCESSGAPIQRKSVLVALGQQAT